MAQQHHSRTETAPGGIDANHPFQVEYVHHQFPWLSHDQVENAIREKGPNPNRVLTYLQQQPAKKSK